MTIDSVDVVLRCFVLFSLFFSFDCFFFFSFGNNIFYRCIWIGSRKWRPSETEKKIYNRHEPKPVSMRSTVTKKIRTTKRNRRKRKKFGIERCFFVGLGKKEEEEKKMFKRNQEKRMTIFFFFSSLLISFFSAAVEIVDSLNFHYLFFHKKKQQPNEEHRDELKLVANKFRRTLFFFICHQKPIRQKFLQKKKRKMSFSPICRQHRRNRIFATSKKKREMKSCEWTSKTKRRR